MATLNFSRQHIKPSANLVRIVETLGDGIPFDIYIKHLTRCILRVLARIVVKSPFGGLGICGVV